MHMYTRKKTEMKKGKQKQVLSGLLRQKRKKGISSLIFDPLVAINKSKRYCCCSNGSKLVEAPCVSSQQTPDVNKIKIKKERRGTSKEGERKTEGHGEERLEATQLTSLRIVFFLMLANKQKRGSSNSVKHTPFWASVHSVLLFFLVKRPRKKKNKKFLQ